MSNTKVWYSGVDNYRKHTLKFGKKRNTFTLELLDVKSRNISTVHDAFEMHLHGANLPVEVLYSGGLDSECVIAVCLDRKIPVEAITQRLLIRGAPINIADLYYAEKYCREHNVKHRIIDLDIEKFYNNGDHIQYMESFRFMRFPTAPLLWLMEQCSSFPVVGGDYTWPQVNIGNEVYSPHRHEHICHDLYMRERGISGIGNMISHSIDSNILFIKEHLKIFNNDISYKHNMFCNLGFNLEKRHRSHGWETIDDYSHIIDWREITRDLYDRYGETISVIKWNKTFADLIGGKPGKNDSYGK